MWIPFGTVAQYGVYDMIGVYTSITIQCLLLALLSSILLSHTTYRQRKIVSTTSSVICKCNHPMETIPPTNPAQSPKIHGSRLESGPNSLPPALHCPIPRQSFHSIQTRLDQPARHGALPFPSQVKY
ncbi:hypothetical protein VTL71DRAFT_3797 [Oculimacula yallundae]|uniref:Uncharacterized protein n=1 Tax=Oculimacula yallundae TaxID=86028 RepID=A0ABR4C428_9HELO